MCGLNFLAFVCGCVILRNMQGPFHITLYCATYYMATLCISLDCAICKCYNPVLCHELRSARHNSSFIQLLPLCWKSFQNILITWPRESRLHRILNDLCSIASFRFVTLGTFSLMREDVLYFVSRYSTVITQIYFTQQVYL